MALFSRSRPRTPTVLPDRVEIGVGGRQITVRVRRHPAARRYTLRVGRIGADPVVTVPPGGSLGGALSFLERHTDWLGARLKAQPAARPFADGELIPLRGLEHRLVRRASLRGTVEVRGAAGGGMPWISVPGDDEHLARRLTDWLKREARRDLEAAVFRHSARIGIKPIAIRLRDPKARWGSCSSRGNLSFSWRLILAPPHVLDYLAAHEVAHLREMHHGPSFWRLTRLLCPDTDRAEAWLRAHGSSLFAYGADAED